MNKTCCMGFAVKTAIDYLKQPLLNDLKREYNKAVNELWYDVFMKECTCTNIDIIKRQDYFKFKDSNDIFKLGINAILDKNEYLEELICVTVELDESNDPDTIIKSLVKYATDFYDFEIDNNGIETKYVNVYSHSITPDLFIIINTDDLNGGTIIKMLTNNADRSNSNLSMRKNVLLNTFLFESFIEGLLVKHVISKYEKIDLGNIVTTNFLETKSISNVSFDIDSNFVIVHKDLFLEINKSLDQNDTYDTIKHTIFEPRL